MANNEITIVVTARDGASPVLNRVEQNAQRVAASSGQALQVVGTNADRMTIALGKGATGFGLIANGASNAIWPLTAMSAALDGVALKVIQLATDMFEQRQAAQVTFKENFRLVNEFATKQAAAWNIATVEAFNYSASIGQIIKSTGVAEGEAATMSTTIIKLAADLASFRNLRIDEALTKIVAGLAGEIRPLRDVGVFLSEAAVQQQAYTMGLAKTGAELDEGTKVLARYALILEGLKDAQGDVARTAVSAANQWRNVRQEAIDLATKTGELLLPAVAKILKTFADLLDLLTKIPAPILATVAAVAIVAGGLATFGAAAAGAIIMINGLSAAYANLTRAAGAAAVAQGAQAATTVASGVASAAASGGQAATLAAEVAMARRARRARDLGATFRGGVFATGLQRTLQMSGPSSLPGRIPGRAATGALAGTEGAVVGGAGATVLSGLTSKLGALASTVNPLAAGFAVLATALVGAHIAVQSFAQQLRERSKDVVGRTTGQFAGIVRGAESFAETGAAPRDVLARIEADRANLMRVRAGLQAELAAAQAGPQTALTAAGIQSTEKQIADLDAAISRLGGQADNVRAPMDKMAALFAKSANDIMASGRGEEIGGTAQEIADQFFAAFKAAAAEEGSDAAKELKRMQQAATSGVGDVVVKTFETSGMAAAKAFRATMPPMESLERKAVDLSRALGIDLVAAMGLVIGEVNAFQSAINAAESRRQAKAQELRDLFPNSDEGAGFGEPSDFPGVTGIERIRMLQENARGAGGTAGPKGRTLADVIKDIQERFNDGLADALVTGGKPAMEGLREQQARLWREIDDTARMLSETLKIDLVDAMDAAAQAVIGASDAINGIVEATDQRFKGDLARAFVEGNGGIEKYNKVLAEQGPLLAKIAHTAQIFRDQFGFNAQEAFAHATDAVLNEFDRLKSELGRNELQGFLGQLAARRSAIGLNAIEGFNVRPGVGGGGGQPITINRTIGTLVVQNGDQQSVVAAIEQADAPTIRLARQAFAEAR